jgi:hypothetical protein
MARTELAKSSPVMAAAPAIKPSQITKTRPAATNVKAVTIQYRAVGLTLQR